MAHPGIIQPWCRLLSDPHTRLWVVSLNVRDGHMGDNGHTRWALSSRAVL